ncbi:NtaA/DmoA family FMN-dependent monooxygenase [Mycolicibacterium frederiksbergense]|uniref:NtaA/DmoA family FMN-dependent monooxygenase n=1 Tax=Mycolicibacterium frederiksbergense TaxID=117567 RepID=UPI00265C76F0|nr:NtaA/DmoA family FMN-dependent monooxygenase [Mycolicibacterium frederiksbergense]MDO0975329.1 NtaA/DmoA family FMN-dependent monooxygenase [Mycolicibacterium frederiksbergense]
MTKKIHLGWFMNFTPPDWESEWASPDVADWANGKFYVDMAKNMERACFDFMMIEDTVMVADAYGGTMEGSLKNAIFAPKQDPVPLAIQVACNTTNLGVVATMSTSFYPPYLLARLCSTADSIAQGRFGWNIVSSAEDRAAQNFGLEGLPEHDERYNVAEEYFDVVNQLWDSWEADAVVMDRETHTFADFNKVHTIDFDGKYFKSRGPLNTVPSPQHRPTFLQAGASPKGRQFAAGAADAIIAVGTGVEGMKEYRDDVRARAKASGRNPDDIKLFFVVSPTIAATEAEARAAHERFSSSDLFVEKALVAISSNTEIDFKQFDLDQPLPTDLTTNGERGSLEHFMRGDGTPGPKTLRQLAVAAASFGMEFVGTPEQVADEMEAAINEIGGDGFLLWRRGLTRSYIESVCDGLVPELQRRGLTRTEYTKSTLRETLREF